MYVHVLNLLLPLPHGNTTTSCISLQGASVLQLGHTYRLQPPLLQAANSLIARNRGRVTKPPSEVGVLFLGMRFGCHESDCKLSIPVKLLFFILETCAVALIIIFVSSFFISVLNLLKSTSKT